METANKKPKHGFKRNPIIGKEWSFLAKHFLYLKHVWRNFRTHRSVTGILGAQYVRSHEFIEIDITYRCNLYCLNCNRSVRQAPEELDISIHLIHEFVNQSLRREIKWKRIRILGGEPTLHPNFIEIVHILNQYTLFNSDCEIQVVTNGYSKQTIELLKQLPKDIWIENTRKVSPNQTRFAPFNNAPCDIPHLANKDFTNGCAIMEECGMGLTPLGYYPCAISGGIDRIAKLELGRASIPNKNDKMLNEVSELCRFCGRFIDGHFIPLNLRMPLEQETMSQTWKELYTKWHQTSQHQKNDSQKTAELQ